jgi:Na+:H+ antiporter, NhaA family
MQISHLAAKPISILRRFLETEPAGGLVLIAAAILAVILANSPFSQDYFHVLHQVISPSLSDSLGPMTVHLWINDGLMALFFMLVGLEVKREFIDGHLADWADRRLPIIAAIAGMIMPALVYIVVTNAHATLRAGWAIPAATDIAFAMAILALLGSRIPASIKLLLVTIAIVDDIGAVAIIAVFYTQDLNLSALAAAALIWGGMMGLNRLKLHKLLPYLLLSVALWYAVLLSGVHATIAGVLAAFAIPLRISPAAPDDPNSPLHRLEHALAIPVAFIILPLFGFANAGVELDGLTLSALSAPLPLGIAGGLFLGKQIGIFASIWACVRLGIAAQPKGASWQHIYGLSCLCGIGFTMSLFIGGLAFNNATQSDAVKIGVLMGSIAAAVLGWVVLRLAPTTRLAEDQPN